MASDPRPSSDLAPAQRPGAEALGRPRADESTDHAPSGLTGSERMLLATTERMQTMHVHQVHREPWPDFSAFDCEKYDANLRRAAAVQWAGRARAEHGSIHQFSALSHTLCEARVSIQVLGSLARLITDEVRHAELCAEMALTCFPEGKETDRNIFGWGVPRAPWSPAPKAARNGKNRIELLEWGANAIMIACCLGETLSRPMLDALALVSTDSVAEAVAKQILRDEHFHAAFGWEALGLLLQDLDDDARARLQTSLAVSLYGFEATTCGDISIESVIGQELVIERDESQPNLGTLTYEQYAMIFYATLEQEIFPKFDALGFDSARAWAERLSVRKERSSGVDDESTGSAEDLSNNSTDDNTRT